MSITLNLPQDLEDELAREAAHLGLSVADYALRLLVTGRPTFTALRTGAEVVAYWQQEGLLGTRPDIADSQAHARAIRSQVEHRARE